jgi:PKD repeat protein
MRLRISILFALALASASVASATTIVVPTDEQLIDKSLFIAAGEVLSSAAVDRQGTIWTETQLRVDRTLKGELPAVITVRELGGELNERFNVIFGGAEYEPGERVLVFLSRDGDVYRTRDMFVGKFTEKTALDGGRLWHRPASQNTRLLDGNLRDVSPSGIERKADDFERYVRDRVAGKVRHRDYETTTTLASGGPSGISANFTLLEPSRVYRWTLFEKGKTADWYHVGAQTGYSGGGLTETRTGIDSWTAYTGANIRYRYVGASSASAAGLRRPNGVNEIVFDDATNEIEGTYNRSTGGVVGVGGFNNVEFAGSWSSPFAADAAHPQQTYSSTYAITEANLVIQNGVTPSNGISSLVLAEILAHEIGHTLGIGHSPTNTSLMYASITRGGPSLKPDDQAAARWLYPASSVAPAPTASYSYSPASPTVDTTIAFRDESSGAPTSWSWNFGDGTQSTQQHPGKRYAAPGTYSVSLTATNAGGSSTSTRSVVVASGVPAAPTVVADFAMSTSTAAVGQAITFSDRSSGSPTRWSWSFGDGTSSTLQNPTKSFASAGTFNVTLTASNAGGSSSKTRTIAVAASVPQFRTYVPVTAQTAGSQSTYWRTELTLFNAGAASARVTLVFLPSAGSSLATREITLAANASATYSNALRDLFGISAGSGALAIEATAGGAGADLRVSSRTFTESSGGTYGQAVPAVREDDAPASLFLTGLASSTDFRTNIGLVNRSATPVTSSLVLFDESGRVIGQTQVTTAGGAFQQQPLTALFPNAGSGQLFSLRLSSPVSGALFAYASIVDNRSQDPIYVGASGQPSSALRIIPGVGRTAGANGTFWRSDVTFFNPSSAGATVRLRFLANGADNSAAPSRSFSIPSGRSVAIADVVTWLGLGGGNGALEVSATGAVPVITARTYTNRTVDNGTFGQSIDAIATVGLSSVSTLTGLKSDGTYRSNIGVVNGGNRAATVSLSIYSASGQLLGNTVLVVPPLSQLQASALALFPNLPSSGGGAFTVRASADTTSIAAWGSVVDNQSGDPIFIAGE